MTLEEFALKYIMPLVLAGIAAIPGVLSLLKQQAKEKAEISKLSTEGVKIKADTVETFEGIARRTAEDVIKRDARIEAMEVRMDAQDAEIAKMKIEKKALEDRIDAQDKEIASLKEERDLLLKKNEDQESLIEKLTARVKTLEDTLRDNKIPIPNGGHK